MAEDRMTPGCAAWLIVAQGGWWKVREIVDLLPDTDAATAKNLLWAMERRYGSLVSRGEGENREYSLAPNCTLPRQLAVKDVLGALVGQETTAPTPRSDLWLMRQALNALDGVIEVAAQRGVKPTDVTQTVRASLRRRLAHSALAQHSGGT